MNTKNLLLIFATAFIFSTSCKKDNDVKPVVKPVVTLVVTPVAIPTVFNPTGIPTFDPTGTPTIPPTTPPTTPPTIPPTTPPTTPPTIPPPIPPTIPVGQAAINLGAAGNFVVLAGALISNVPASAITGNIGLSPAAGSGITGLGGPQITGTIYTVDATGPAGSVTDAVGLTTAKGDLTIAYNEAAGRTATNIVLLPPGNIGGLTLTPGLYKSSGALEISSGDLTFDARGNANAIFIIQIASSFNTTSGRQIFLTGGALAKNIFWQVGSSATLGTTSVFKGTIMADQSISVNTGAVVEGRLLARIGAITLISNTIVRP